MIDRGGGRKSERDAKRCAEHAEHSAFKEELGSTPAAAHTQCPRRADLRDALHDIHAHGVRHGEQDYDSDEHGYEGEHGAKEIFGLPVIGVDLAKVAHLELQSVLLK